MSKQQEKISYRVFAFRLHEGTYEKLKQLRAEKGKSWNRLFYELLQNELAEEHESQNTVKST
jgi:hypothetical protein